MEDNSELTQARSTLVHFQQTLRRYDSQGKANGEIREVYPSNADAPTLAASIEVQADRCKGFFAPMALKLDNSAQIQMALELTLQRTQDELNAANICFARNQINIDDLTQRTERIPVLEQELSRSMTSLSEHRSQLTELQITKEIIEARKDDLAEQLISCNGRLAKSNNRN